MGTGLWQDGADQQVFHCLFIPTLARCLSILVESPFLHKGFVLSSQSSIKYKDVCARLFISEVARLAYFYFTSIICDRIAILSSFR